ncbi:MAG: hypothetical protein CMH27_04115 [Micavibrio sp.]|nr:hypothetical protein [Micavibrio sp.]|tara:strand:+ start:3707 stop:5137 length:1431 start_codon:yes stop_codon:yes gene_type:complete
MPVYLLFCHRFFELRFIVVSGILKHLAERGTVTLMLPEDLKDSFRPLIPEGVTLETSHYKSKLSPLKNLVLNTFGDILYLTFPNTDQLPNATAQFHRDHYKPGNRLKYHLVLAMARLASKSPRALRLCTAIYQSLLPKTIHHDLINKISPDLMIGCSFGLSIEDAAFLAEARHHNVKSAVIVQSWDRTSNKGYPTIHPDHALVWNDIMKQECLVHLNFQDDQVHVTGSPLWDEHFNKCEKDKDPSWRSDLNIPKSAKVLFFSCGGFGSHPANMQIIPRIFDLARRQPFDDEIYIVFRMYPQYLSPVTQSGPGKAKKDEIEALLERYKDEHHIRILYPQVEFDGKNFMPSAQDHAYMTECLRQCDVSISQVSSQMIEACIFDKPAINMEFGRRVTDKYDLEIADYKTEHLLRLYRTGAIYRVQTPEQIEPMISEALNKPGTKKSQRCALVDQEAPVNRGTASIATAQTLRSIATTTT